MAISDAYANVEDYRAIKGLKGSERDEEIKDGLLAWSRWIDRDLSRPAGFNRDAAVVARYFYGRDKAYLDVDEIAATTGLLIKIDEDQDGSFADETALVATDYELWPLNAGVGPEPAPWRRIVLPSWSTKGSFPSGSKVEVTAIWGWPAVPPMIRELVVELEAIWLVQSQRATQRMNEMDQVVGMSPLGQSLVNRAREAYSMVVLA